MTAIEAQANGFVGTGHGADYFLRDKDVAYIAPAKAAAMTLIDLLVDGAAKAKSVIANYQPPMTRAAYLEFMRSLAKDQTWDYTEE
jgi:predicted HAD superfamily phosphohydrolase